jgi:hypothetical protein
MSIDTFEYILSKFRDGLQEQTSNWRRPIGAEESLVVNK